LSIVVGGGSSSWNNDGDGTTYQQQQQESLDIEAPTRLDRDKFASAFARFLGVPLIEEDEHDDERMGRSGVGVGEFFFVMLLFVCCVFRDLYLSSRIPMLAHFFRCPLPFIYTQGEES
jgi:hypothetical protein